MRPAYGLYHPSHEHDACGVGFIANLRGEKSHQLVKDAVRILINLEHRGAVGADRKTGDGAGMLLQLPARLFPAGRRRRPAEGRPVLRGLLLPAGRPIGVGPRPRPGGAGAPRGGSGPSGLAAGAGQPRLPGRAGPAGDAFLLAAVPHPAAGRPGRASRPSAGCTCCAAAWKKRPWPRAGARSASTSLPCPAGPSCTRACSCPRSSCPSTRT